MPNTAEPATLPDGSLDTRGEFFVDGEAIQRALQVAKLEGHELDARVLWHTHVATTEPSAEDIAEFPSWLAHVGMVYHVPSDTITLYNESGIISSTSTDADGALATSEE
jgi:hypothetical protein